MNDVVYDDDSQEEFSFRTLIIYEDDDEILTMKMTRKWMII